MRPASPSPTVSSTYVIKTRLKLKEQALASEDFADLWRRISRQTTYRLQFSTNDVVASAIGRINGMPEVEPVKFRRAVQVRDRDQRRGSLRGRGAGPRRGRG